MHIIDLPTDKKNHIRQMAELLLLGFREHWPTAWANLEAAIEEAEAAAQPEKILRLAVNEQGTVLGWIGGISEYDGAAWELHPLVVHPDHQGQGIGQALVADLEAQVRARGGLTIYLGSDDEDDMTSLSNANLYERLWEQIAQIKNLKRHPYEFYQKQGYSIVGVIPDANGPGKPDILMAKKIN